MLPGLSGHQLNVSGPTVKRSAGATAPCAASIPATVVDQGNCSARARATAPPLIQRYGQQRLDAVGQADGGRGGHHAIAGWDEFPGRAGRRHDDRGPAGERFEDGRPEGLHRSRCDRDVRRADQVRQAAAVCDVAEESHGEPGGAALRPAP